MGKIDPELIETILNSPINKWFLIGGFVALFAGGGAVTFLPVHEEYETVFMLIGIVMMVIGGILAVWRAFKMRG